MLKAEFRKIAEKDPAEKALMNNIKQKEGEKPGTVSTTDQEGLKWDDKKVDALFYLSEGYKVSEVAAAIDVNPATVNKWMQYKEFKERLEKNLVETGLAVKSERISRLKRMADKVEKVFYSKVEQLLMNPTDEKLRDLSQEFRELLKQIAIEKEELVQITKHQYEGQVDINVNHQIDNIEQRIKQLDDSSKIRQEFEEMAEDIITTLVNEHPRFKNNQQEEIIDVEFEEIEGEE